MTVRNAPFGAPYTGPRRDEVERPREVRGAGAAVDGVLAACDALPLRKLGAKML